MEIRIRWAEAADTGAIAQVHMDTRQTTYAGILIDENLADFSYADCKKMWEETLKTDWPATSMLVAETDGGEVVGFAYVAPEREGNRVYRGEIFAIYVLDECQRQGIGRRLFSAAAKHFLKHGIDSMQLWVFKENHPARRFYESMGGEYLDHKTVTISGTDLVMVSYGWKHIASLAAGKCD